MIGRRAIIAGLGGAAIAPVLPVRAQPAKRPVVALVLHATDAEIEGPEPSNVAIRAFLRGLRDLGWIEGETITILRRATEGRRERAPAMFAEVTAAGADVVFLGGASWIHAAARQNVPATPLVAMFADDPVAAGYASSLARPGGRFTGVTRHAGPELYGKWLELLRELAPGISRTAFLAPGGTLQDVRRTALPAGASVVPLRVEDAAQIDEAFAAIERERADSVMVATGPLFHAHAGRIAAFATERRLPSLSAIREIAAAGGLVSYGPDVQAQFRQAARHVDQILKGVEPGDLPIEQPTKFELVLNLKAAKALGISVPPALLLRADEVIE